MRCSNCGAVINKNDEKCTFCGAMNYHGARKKYMDSLYLIKNSMENSYVESRKTFLHTLLISIIKALVILAAAAALSTGVFAFNSVRLRESERQYAENEWKEVMWANENYHLLNELYEEGNFEGIHEFVKNGNNGAFYQWEHYDIYYFYNYYRSSIVLRKLLDNGESVKEYKYMIANTLTTAFAYENNLYYSTLDEIEKNICDKMSEECLEIFEIMGYSYDETRSLYESSLENGYINTNKLAVNMEGN